jgi:hypothetical protein
MLFIKSKYYPFKGYNAITHWPFVFYKKDSQKMRVHEVIHGEQQKEMLIVFFYIWYFVEWIFKGYDNISFEREAYDKESDPFNIMTRKRYSWLHYLKRN